LVISDFVDNLLSTEPRRNDETEGRN